MKTTRFAALSVAAALTLLVSGAAARADHFDFDPICELSGHVQSHSRDLLREARRQLTRDPNYGHFVADVTAIYRQAGRVDSLGHAGFDHAELCRSIRQLDALVHHLEETVADLRPGHSHYDHWTHSHTFHGPDLRNIRRLVRLIEQDTHELLDQVHHVETYFSAAPVRRPGIAVTPGGVYLGGRGFSVRLSR